MDNIDKLFVKNSSYVSRKNLRIEKAKIYFRSRDTEFSFETIKKIIEFINGVKKEYKNQKITLCFSFNEDIQLIDKLSYILLECIFYFLVKDGYKIELYWKPKEGITTDGVFSSPLLRLVYKKGDFIQKFNFDTYRDHFRKVIREDSPDYLSKFSSSINSFLTIRQVPEKYIEEVTSVCEELVGNACEHAETSCLFDIDVTDRHGKLHEGVQQEGEYIGINIAVINFSEKLFLDNIKGIIGEKSEISDRYKRVNDIYSVHKKKFNENYTEDDFWSLMSLQDKISGRNDNSITGGTGSTVLIKSLQEKADNDNCYFVTGSRTGFFLNDILNYDDEFWIGFNKENNIHEFIPDDNVFHKSHINLPGTAFNINLVMKASE